MVLYVIIGIAAFALLGFVVSYVIVNALMYNKFFCRQKDEWMTKHALEDAHYDGCREEILQAAKSISALPFTTITCLSSDGLTLSARLYDTGKRKLVAFFHGAHAVPENNFAVIAQDFVKCGYDFMFVDERAHWNSQGKRISYGAMESDDVLRWLDRLSDYPLDEIVLYGSSMGASAIALASDKIDDPRVKALVVDCGFTSVNELKNNLLAPRHVPLWIVGAAFSLGERVAKAQPTMSTKDHVSKTRVPMLFLQGERDAVVPTWQSEQNYSACSSKKKLIIVPDAGHTTASVIGGEQVRKQILDFCNYKEENQWQTNS